MNKVNKHKNYLHVLKDSDNKVRQFLLRNANKEQKQVVLEGVVNLLNNNIPLSAKQKQALSKHKSKLRRLCESCYKNNKIINNKKVEIEQIGGAIPLLLAPLLALAAKAAVGGAVSAGASYATKKIIDSATK